MTFPLNPPEVGRSTYANDHPIAPCPQAGAQNDEFVGMANFGDQGTEHASNGPFGQGNSEAIGARHNIRQSQPQTRALISAIAPEATSGSNGGYIMSPAVAHQDHPL